MLEQNRALWDQLLIHRGLAALARAEELSRVLGRGGTYTLQAAIAACHARAITADATDWPRIAALYAALAQVAPSPVVELNRAVAVSHGRRPGSGPRHHRHSAQRAVAEELSFAAKRPRRPSPKAGTSRRSPRRIPARRRPNAKHARTRSPPGPRSLVWGHACIARVGLGRSPVLIFLSGRDKRAI